ncbi:MAG: archaellin/type IV pilin N-terminal domain-containing protein [archaeon]
MKNKRGIAPVIATVLLIVIVLAAVGILIGFIIPMIERSTEDATLCYEARLEIVEENSCIETVMENEQSIDKIKVRVKRDSGEFDLKGIVFRFSTGESTTTEKIRGTQELPLPGVLEEQTFRTFRFENIDDLTSVSIAPIVGNGNREKTCDYTSEITITRCR